MSPVYEAVNIAQRTPWRINARILDVMQTMWDADMHHGGIPNRDDLPMPVCPRCGKVPEKREHKHTDDIAHECFRDPLVFKAWNHEARMTHRQNARLVSHRLMLMKILWTAGKLKDAPRIYFPYQIDFRGRLYAIPQFLNPQGSDLAKGLLEFAEAKPIMSKEAADWLAIHVANTWGEDKISFGDRVQWVKDHEDMLRAVVLNPLSNLEWTDADSPFCFLSAAIDWVGYLDEGFGHLSRTPIAQDGTCSGLQHYSALLRDEVGGKAVNLLPSVKPQDVYAVVADKALENMKALTVHDDNYEMAQKWINSGIINRKTTKRAVMTLPYGVTYRSARNYIRDYILDVQENHPEKIPWEPDELGSAISYLSTAVWEAIGEVVIAAPKAMKWLREVGKAAVNLDANAPVYWRSPSGLPILQTYKDLEYRRVKTILSGNVLINTGADCAGSLEEKSVRIDLTMAEPGDTVDKHRQISAFAPNFIHALDASALVFAVVKAYHDDGIQSYALIHDSFGTHAGGEGCGDSARLAKSLRKAFIDMYRTHDVLQNLLDGLNLPSEALEQVLPIPAKGGLNLNDIEQSPYFFA
jgi:DNA-directed RNA polymerase